MQVWRLKNAPDSQRKPRSGGSLEELAILSVVAAAALVGGAAYVVAEIFGMMMGLGWGHYSKKLKATEEAKKELKTD